MKSVLINLSVVIQHNLKILKIRGKLRVSTNFWDNPRRWICIHISHSVSVQLIVSEELYHHEFVRIGRFDDSDVDDVELRRYTSGLADCIKHCGGEPLCYSFLHHDEDECIMLKDFLKVSISYPINFSRHYFGKNCKYVFRSEMLKCF